MKVLVINPNVSEDVTRLIDEGARAAAPAGMRIDTVHACFGAEVIETEAEMVIAAHAVLDAAARHVAGHDGVVVAGFADPGLAALRELLPGIAVVGIGETALLSLGHEQGKFGIVTAGAATVAGTRKAIETARLAGRLTSIVLLDRPLRSVATDQATVLREATAAIDGLARAGAETVLLAGAPLTAIAARLAGEAPVRLVDGVTAAIAHLGGGAGPGPRMRREGTIQGRKRLVGLSRDLIRLMTS